MESTWINQTIIQIKDLMALINVMENDKRKRVPSAQNARLKDIGLKKMKLKGLASLLVKSTDGYICEITYEVNDERFIKQFIGKYKDIKEFLELQAAISHSKLVILSHLEVNTAETLKKLSPCQKEKKSYFPLDSK